MRIFILLLTFLTTPLIGSFSNLFQFAKSFDNPTQIFQLIEDTFRESNPEIAYSKTPCKAKITDDLIISISHSPSLEPGCMYHLKHTPETREYFQKHNISDLCDKEATDFCFKHGKAIVVKRRLMFFAANWLVTHNIEPTRSAQKTHTIDSSYVSRISAHLATNRPAQSTPAVEIPHLAAAGFVGLTAITPSLPH